ncbi:unnamed protein product [Amoebophrya sp. A120]|nr:unnamed protein product [Amoebophrya sp. A120]|eukprot:GSA120T00015815001.1
MGLLSHFFLQHDQHEMETPGTLFHQTAFGAVAQADYSGAGQTTLTSKIIPKASNFSSSSQHVHYSREGHQLLHTTSSNFHQEDDDTFRFSSASTSTGPLTAGIAHQEGRSENRASFLLSTGSQPSQPRAGGLGHQHFDNKNNSFKFSLAKPATTKKSLPTSYEWEPEGVDVEDIPEMGFHETKDIGSKIGLFEAKLLTGTTVALTVCSTIIQFRATMMDVMCARKLLNETREAEKEFTYEA